MTPKPRLSFLLRPPVLFFLVHAYVGWRLASGVFGSEARWAVILMLAFVYLIMIAGFLARNAVGVRAADSVSWAGFLLLGFFSWLFVLTLLRDVLLLLWFLIGLGATFHEPAFLFQFEEYSALTVIALSIAATLLGLFNARRLPAVVPVDIVLRDLPDALDGFQIAQITDLHVGPTIKKNFVAKVVNKTNMLNADLIVMTGDMVDGSVERLSKHTLPLSLLTAPHGVYLITGNHEYYVGADPWIAEFRRLGITVLLNQHETLCCDDARLVLAGVTDFGAEKFNASQASDPVEALRNAPDDAAVKILLAHQPRSVFAAANLGFDLQLSGHTHGGQYWPWAYFVPLQQPFVAGLHRYQDMQVYVSRGAGYWGPPLRLGARSEITLLRLRRKESVTT